MKLKYICACNKCFGFYTWCQNKFCNFIYCEEKTYALYYKKYDNSTKAIEIIFCIITQEMQIINYDFNTFKKNLLYKHEMKELKTFEYVEDYANKVINNLMFV